MIILRWILLEVLCLGGGGGLSSDASEGSSEHANYREISDTQDGDYQVYDLLGCVVM
jgi:hypothetical protein